MFFKDIKFTTPSKLKFLLARIFGKKVVSKDGGVTMTLYRWQRQLYVTKVDIEPEPYRTKKNITSMMEFVYPDRGGYTGFSILVWVVRGEVPNSYRLESPWGSADREAQDIKSNYVMEARFFVFGSLLGYAVEGRESFSEIEGIAATLCARWMPLMDKVIDTEKKLWGEESRTGICIGEVVNDELRNAVKGVIETNRVLRWPDHDNGRYEDYHKLVSFRKAKKGDY